MSDYATNEPNNSDQQPIHQLIDVRPNKSDQLDQSSNSNRSNKKLSFTNLLKGKFKRKSNRKLKSNDEQKAMVRSISIAFTQDTYKADDAYSSQKQNNLNVESISNLYLNEDSRSSTNEQRTKKTKLQKFGKRLRSKFKFRNNSLDDRSTDLDDSLEHHESDDSDLVKNSNERFVNRLNLTAESTNNNDSQPETDQFDGDLISNRIRTNNLKLRPKSEIFAGDNQLIKSNLSKNRFTTIEVMRLLKFAWFKLLTNNDFLFVLEFSKFRFR